HPGYWWPLPGRQPYDSAWPPRLVSMHRSRLGHATTAAMRAVGDPGWRAPGLWAATQEHFPTPCEHPAARGAAGWTVACHAAHPEQQLYRNGLHRAQRATTHRQGNPGAAARHVQPLDP